MPRVLTSADGLVLVGADGRILTEGCPAPCCGSPGVRYRLARACDVQPDPCQWRSPPAPWIFVRCDARCAGGNALAEGDVLRLWGWCWRVAGPCAYGQPPGALPIPPGSWVSDAEEHACVAGCADAACTRPYYVGWRACDTGELSGQLYSCVSDLEDAWRLGGCPTVTHLGRCWWADVFAGLPGAGLIRVREPGFAFLAGCCECLGPPCTHSEFACPVDPPSGPGVPGPGGAYRTLGPRRVCAHSIDGSGSGQAEYELSFGGLVTERGTARWQRVGGLLTGLAERTVLVGPGAPFTETEPLSRNLSGQPFSPFDAPLRGITGWSWTPCLPGGFNKSFSYDFVQSALLLRHSGVGETFGVPDSRFAWRFEHRVDPAAGACQPEQCGRAGIVTPGNEVDPQEPGLVAGATDGARGCAGCGDPARLEEVE